MPNPRMLLAWLVLSASAALMVGCTPSDPLPPNSAWHERMGGLLSDPQGQGGASGDFIAESRNASVTLASVTAGSHDVLAVCTGVEVMRLTVSDNGQSGNDRSPDGTLASADIACGATLTLSVTIPAGGVILTVRSDGGAGGWQFAIVSPGWSPTPTVFSR